MPTQQRHVDLLTKDTLAFVMAGGRGSRLFELTDFRCKPAVFFGGRFRVIDFPLSNCVNSGIRRIAVLTQYRAHSLIYHIMRGWTQFRSDLGEFVQVLPASQQTYGNWYTGTADSIFQNLDIVQDERPKYTLILSGDHVYKMDYGRMLAQHVDHGADVSVACLPVPLEKAANAYGVMSVNQHNQVVSFAEKPSAPEPMPGRPDLALASMGNYIFNTELLFDALSDDAYDPSSAHDFGKNVLPKLINSCKVTAYPFTKPDSSNPDYWRDVGTLDAYWEANMDLVSVSPELNLYDDHWPILSNQSQLPPAKFVFDQANRRGQAIDSAVSGGCIVSGAEVHRSLLFSNAVCNSYATVSDSLLLPQVSVGRRCHIHKAIIDRGCNIPAGMNIGINREQDIARGFRITEAGVVLVTPKMLGQNRHHFHERRSDKTGKYAGAERRESSSDALPA